MASRGRGRGRGRPIRETPVTTKLFVGNLPDTVRKSDLVELFEKFGNVAEADIVNDYAFVHYESEEEAKAAVTGLHETEFNGKNIRVELSHSRVRQKPGMGSEGECFRCGKSGHWSKDCPRGPSRRRPTFDDPYDYYGYDRDRYYDYPPDPYRDRYLRDRYSRYDPYDRYERIPPPPLPPRDSYRDRSREYERDPYARPPPDYYKKRERSPLGRDPYEEYYRRAREDYYDYYRYYYSRRSSDPRPDPRSAYDREHPAQTEKPAAAGAPEKPANYTDFTNDDPIF